jgi:hypothetical protein
MDISICSFSFHRLLAAGKQDIFQYIKDCKDLGCTLLDPWNAHLAPLQEGDKVLHAGHNPHDAQLSTADEDYIQQVKPPPMKPVCRSAASRLMARTSTTPTPKCDRPIARVLTAGSKSRKPERAPDSRRQRRPRRTDG